VRRPNAVILAIAHWKAGSYVTAGDDQRSGYDVQREHFACHQYEVRLAKRMDIGKV